MLPVWVDEELGGNNTLFDVVKRKLTAWFTQEEVETELIQLLLRKLRILVIVDRLSERSVTTQQYLSTIHGGLKVNAVLVTTRQIVNFEATGAVVYPAALDSKSLLHFMTTLLEQYKEQAAFGERQAFASIGEQLDLGNRLAALIQVRGKGNQEVPILPLPVRIFVDEALQLIHEGRSLDGLPSSLPEAYFRSLEKVNPKTPDTKNGMTDEAMLRAAKVLGRLATESDFIPKEFSRGAARDRLQSAGWTDKRGPDPVQRLLDNGVLTERKCLSNYWLRFQLDPIAEFLSAAAWAEDCGRNIDLWTNLKRDSAAASGFQIALRLTSRSSGLGLEWDS